MFAIRENLVLQGQEGTTGVDEVNAREVVFSRDVLRAQVLLHRDRKIRAAFDSCVVGHDDDFLSLHPADAGDDSGRGCRVVIHAFGRERGQFEER